MGDGKKSLAENPAARALIALVIMAGSVWLLLALTGDGFYVWAKALHVVAIISWMAAMFYLPRLFVYHAKAEPGSVQSETFKTMENRLLRAIMNPAMVAAWIFGLYLAIRSNAFAEGWFHVKLLAVILLSGVHGYLSASVRRFSSDGNRRSERHWRIVNEIPTLLMVVIVVMVIVRPF